MDNFEFYEHIERLLTDRGTISLVEYEKFKNLVNKTRVENDLEESIACEKTKMLNEKIQMRIKEKQPHQFIHDYFIGGKDIKELEFTTPESDPIREDNQKIYNSAKYIFENLSNTKVEKLNTIMDSLALTSKDFLKTKLELSDNDILDLKGNTEVVKETIPQKVDEYIPKSVLNLGIIKKEKKIRITQGADKIDKDIEDDLNNEIFSYLKGMKNYGQSFHQILTTDNKRLTKIEQQQLKDQTKTNKELKNLTEFNYTLKLGFWKTLMLIIIVLTTFMFTLLLMRIFPKFVK
jgi:hypothetical protein